MQARVNNICRVPIHSRPRKKKNRLEAQLVQSMVNDFVR